MRAWRDLSIDEQALVIATIALLVGLALIIAAVASLWGWQVAALVIGAILALAGVYFGVHTVTDRER